MDDGFDTSVDTSSFDDGGSDFSDASDFDTSSDVGEIMDDSSFDVSDGFEESDFSEYDDSSFDVGELMDEPSDDFVETSDIADVGSDIIEDDGEDIESLMDDVSADELAETSDVPTDTDFNVESDIVDLMDEAALETTDETADVVEDNLTPTDEVAELMDEDTSDLVEGDIESLDEVDSSDMETEGTDDIESLMDTTDEEVSDTLEEPENIGSDVAIEEDAASDLMDGTDDSNIETLEVEDINGDEVGENVEASIEQISEDLDGTETEMVAENLDDSIIETADAETTDLPSNETSDIEGSAYDRLSEYYSSHNYGQGDYSEYSQDPEWQELNNAYLQEIGQEPIEYGNDTDASAYDRLSEYYSSHNYGQGDYSEYSQDPEWQELNNAYLQEIGKEPIDYSGGDWTDSHVDDMRDELVALGIPEDSPELDAIIENEQAGIDEIRSPSDANDSTEDVLDGVEEVIDGAQAETTDEQVEQINNEVQELDINYDEIYEGIEQDALAEGFADIQIDSDPERLDSSLENFSASTWEGLTLDEQKDSMSKLADCVVDVVGFENPPNIEYYNNEKEGDFGGFDSSTNTLYVNEYMLYNSDEAADTIAHELWHAHQHERSLNPQNSRDYQYQYNFENYIPPELGQEAYEAQLVEAEARAFAAQFKDRLSSIQGRSK